MIEEGETIKNIQKIVANASLSVGVSHAVGPVIYADQI